MPNQTVYIRNEDIEQWKSLGAKSTFIHNALRMIKDGGLEALGLIVDDRTNVVEAKIIKNKDDALKVLQPILPHKTYFKKGKK